MNFNIASVIKLASSNCKSRVETHVSGVNIVVEFEKPEFATTLEEYFLTSSAPKFNEFPYSGVKVIYCHDNSLFFRALTISSRFRVIERVEFHPDNFYEIIYTDESGDILESRGGIRHLILRSHSRKTYCVIVPDYNHEVLEFQKPGIRLIREIVFRAHQRAGYFPLHASAASNGVQGYLFVGDSGAGKTTLATTVSTIARSGVFISSDLTLINHVGTSVKAIGWPGGGISMGTGTLESLHSISPTLLSSPKFLHGEGYVKQGKILLTPAEFSKTFKVRVDTQLDIDAVFFPKIDIRDHAFNVEELSFDEAFDLATDQLRNSLSDTHRYGLFDVLEDSISTTNAMAIEKLAAVLKNVPAYSIQGNPISIAHSLSENTLLV